MTSEILNAMSVSASGMRIQGTRIRVIAENLANAQTLATTPGGDPYTRQQVSFDNVLDRELGIRRVQVDKITAINEKPFATRYIPDHPGANEDGYVKLPNVNGLVESQNAREAQRSYEANLGVLTQSRSMASRTVDLLR